MMTMPKKFDSNDPLHLTIVILAIFLPLSFGIVVALVGGMGLLVKYATLLGQILLGLGIVFGARQYAAKRANAIVEEDRKRIVNLILELSETRKREEDAKSQARRYYSGFQEVQKEIESILRIVNSDLDASLPNLKMVVALMARNSRESEQQISELQSDIKALKFQSASRKPNKGKRQYKRAR